MTPSVPLDAPFETLIDHARTTFGPVEFQSMEAGGVTLDIPQIADMPAYIDKLVGRAGDKGVELPLWAKVWPSAMLLAALIPRLPGGDGDHLLEVGAGVGVCGLFAAAAGFDVTITDVEPDALAFARMAVLKNGLEDRVQVRRADFTKDSLDRTYRYILGCEVVFEPAMYPGLGAFLLKHLDRRLDAEIILAMENRSTAGQFFEPLKDEVDMMRMEAPLADGPDGEARCALVHRLRRKHGA